MKDYVSIPANMYEFEGNDLPFFQSLKIHIKFIFKMLHLIFGYILYVRAERLGDAANQTFDDFRNFLKD